MSSNILSKKIINAILEKCKLIEPDFRESNKNYFCLPKSNYFILTDININNERCELKLIPKYLFKKLFNQINNYSTKNNKSLGLNSFTDDIYGIWVYMLYTEEIGYYKYEELKYADVKLDGNNIDDFIKYYIEYTNKYQPIILCEYHDKTGKELFENRFKLTQEKMDELYQLAEYLKSKMNEKTTSKTNKFEELIINDDIQTKMSMNGSDDENQNCLMAETENNNELNKTSIESISPKKRPRIGRIIESDNDDDDDTFDFETSSDTESETESNNNINTKSDTESEAESNTESYTWNEVEEYTEINLNIDNIPDEIYKDSDDDYKDKTINYVVQIPNELNKIDLNKQYSIDSPEIKKLINNFIDSGLDIDYLKDDDIGCKYYKCDNFLNNIIGREVDPQTMRAYANMIMKVRLGMMPYKRVNRMRSNENFNAFCSNLTEIKSVDQKQHILDTSIKYNPEFKYNYYKYNELCEYIITDYQRLVFDIDVESKKTFNKNKEDEYTVEYSFDHKTIKKLDEELEIVKRFYKRSKNINPKAQLYAYIQYGNKNYWSNEDIENCKSITSQMSFKFDHNWQYIEEFNSKSSKLLSIHFSISGVVYNRKENEYLRQFLMGNIPISDYINDKHIIDNLEFLDKSIYVFTQRAWRFAYSCKQQKKECELPPSELQKHKTILYNLFAFPEKDDVEINLCKILHLKIDTYDKIQTACKQKNSRLTEIYKQINSELQKLDFNNKLHTINKTNDITEFINNRVELPEKFECLIKHPVIVEKLHKLQNNVQGYPNIKKNVLKFVNDCRIMNLDEDNIYNLLLNIEYYHTDGTPNRNKSMIKNLVKYGFKHEIYHTMQLSTDITNERTKHILRYRYWLKEDLIKFLKRLIFKVGVEYVLKEPSSSKKGIELKFYKFSDIKELFSFNVNVFTPYYYDENGKKCGKDDYDKLSIELSSIFLPTLIRNIDLPEYNEINVCVTKNTLKQSGTYAEGFKSYNKYNVHIGYDSDDNPVYDCMKKDKCVRNLTFKDRPQIINDIFKNLLYSPNITEEEFETRKNYFEALFAYKIQNPDMAIQISPIICGAEGICKNTYFGILNGFLNGWCEDELSWDIEMSNFNSQQQDNIIRCYNEVKSTPTAASKLKALITDAMETVNEKNEKRKKSRNLSLKVFLTNERQNNLLNSGSNRRFLYYTPPTTTEEGMELAKKIYINGQIDKKIINDYKKYIFRLDLSNFKIKNIIENEIKYELFNPMQKNLASYLDDMVDFREQFKLIKDATTQFLDKMVEIFKIPEFTNKKRFIPTSFIIDIGNACKNGYNTMNINNFDFTELTNWYRDNVNEKTTWNSKSIATRLKESDSSYALIGETRIANLRKEIESINDEQLKDLLLNYYKNRVSGFLG